MTTETEYLLFERFLPSGRKTPIVKVTSKSTRVALGTIRWHGPWRQYCFYPLGGTIFNVGCMTDIQTVIGELMAERRKVANEQTPVRS